MAEGRDNPDKGSVRLADQASWTGRHIIALVRLYRVEFEVPDDKRDDELLSRIDASVEYLYARGRRTGKHRRGRYAKSRRV